MTNLLMYVTIKQITADGDTNWNLWVFVSATFVWSDGDKLQLHLLPGSSTLPLALNKSVFELSQLLNNVLPNFTNISVSAFYIL